MTILAARSMANKQRLLKHHSTFFSVHLCVLCVAVVIPSNVHHRDTEYTKNAQKL